MNYESQFLFITIKVFLRCPSAEQLIFQVVFQLTLYHLLYETFIICTTSEEIYASFPYM